MSKMGRFFFLLLNPEVEFFTGYLGKLERTEVTVMEAVCDAVYSVLCSPAFRMNLPALRMWRQHSVIPLNWRQ